MHVSEISCCVFLLPFPQLTHLKVGTCTQLRYSEFFCQCSESSRSMCLSLLIIHRDYINDIPLYITPEELPVHLFTAESPWLGVSLNDKSRKEKWEDSFCIYLLQCRAVSFIAHTFYINGSQVLAQILPHALPLITTLPWGRPLDGILQQLLNHKQNQKHIHKTQQQKHAGLNIPRVLKILKDYCDQFRGEGEGEREGKCNPVVSPKDWLLKEKRQTM